MSFINFSSYEMITLKLTLIILQINYCVCVKKYDNYTLYRAVPIDEEQLNYIENLDHVYDVDFWRTTRVTYKPADFMISPKERDFFLLDATKMGIYLTTLISDVQRAFDLQTVKTYIRRNIDTFDWESYYRLDDIYNWIRDLGSQYPDEMSVYSIGKTHENRDILAVSIVLKGCKRRSKVIVEGGIHAREWISPAFVTYMINRIIHAPYSQDRALKEIALTYQWFFVPVVNPDGYEYSHIQDRLWRKNRHDSNFGVDLNRNFDAAFGSVGVSKKRTSDIYCGTAPFSEKESTAMAAFISHHGDELEYYLAFHSYGQYMIIPYAHLKEHVGNFDEVKAMGLNAAAAIQKQFNTGYTVGTAYDTVGYKSSGVSGCWVKSKFKVPYVITFELRDKGTEGFALSPKLILPTCKETMEGLLSFLTPRTKEFRRRQKIKHGDAKFGGQSHKDLEAVVLLLNFLMFIIVRYD